MITRAHANSFVELARRLPVLDVRSPGEFAIGHIPHAHSFPLFDDNERAEIGTIYKQVGQLEAMSRGMDFVGPKVGRMFSEGIALAKEGQLLVHCWRGGKRSESVAGLLSVSGLKITLLEGGYKQYRNWVLSQFPKPYDIAIVGGMTGSGKTEVLHALRDMGENTVDLEHLADHRGSAFGRIGATRNVTFTQFENDLATELSALPKRLLWLEDESRGLGSLQIPNAFWLQMVSSTVFVIELPRSVRMQRLMADYGHFPKELLEQSILKLTRRLGGLRTQETLQALAQDDGYKVMDILLEYYDRAYQHVVAGRGAKTTVSIPFDSFDAQAIAGTLRESCKNYRSSSLSH